MKISDLINDINETTSGGIAIVAQPIGKVIKRPNPSVFAKTKTKENTKDEQLPHCELCKGKGCDACGGTGEEDGYIHREGTLQTGGYGKPKKSRHQQSI